MLDIMQQSVTRLRASRVPDDRGNQVDDWSTPTTVAIPGCSVQPGVTSEDRLNRDTTLIAYTVIAPAGIDVLSTDRIVYSGQTYEIDGEPERWETGILDHTTLYLKRWEG